MRVWHGTGECLQHLRARGYRILATHFEDARPLAEIDFTQPSALVFGNEHAGVSDAVLESADERVVLPMAGFTRSFNISVAAALCLYHIQQDRIRRGGTHGDLTASEQERLTAEFYLRSLATADQILLRVRHDEVQGIKASEGPAIP
jgi:tRNA (guanosine-2'-O-)-methyltransferase